MLSLTHSLVSLPFGLYLDHPLLILIVTFGFHLACDTLLHWNIYPRHFSSYPYFLIALDIGGGVVLAAALVGPHALLSLPLLAALLGGNLPDVLQAAWEFTPVTRRKYWPSLLRTFFHFHDRIQRETTNVAAGLISQIALGGISVLLLLLH